MPAVLIATDIVKCPHTPGVAGPVTAPKLTVGTTAAPVLTGLGSVAGCPIVPPPATNVACSLVTITGGKATKLKVGNLPVLLGSLAATAAGSPGGSLSVTPGQSKLIAI
ncbi:MAG: hypothetical protein IPJ08_21965 [Burkholderiales bacterium]|nr:hypothetical protein [Burkholderiales bacterium]